MGDNPMGVASFTDSLTCVKSKMFLFLSLSIVSSVALGANALPLTGISQDGSSSWNILKLTQSWPPAICIFIENGDKKCNISSNIKSWVIHGLWPTESGTEGPNYCNDSWKFNLSKVEVLRPRLDWNWPSITLDEKPEDSWTHEWDKHGTCGTSLPALKDELHYFNKTLGLHSHFSLSQFLAQGGVQPSAERAYKAEDVLEILHKSLGAYPSITCVEDKKNRKFYLEQVEVCLSKSFQPTDCPSESASDLIFQSETSLTDGLMYYKTLRSNIHDCGSEGIYYKPMP